MELENIKQAHISKIPMAFDEDICEILSPFVNKYKEAGNEVKWKAIVKNALTLSEKARNA